MARVLMAGFSADLKRSLKEKLGSFPVSRISETTEIPEELEGGGVALLLLDLQTDDGSGLRVLEEIRGNSHTARLPVICCTTPDAPDSLERRLANELGVRIILRSPDPGKIGEAVAEALGFCVAPATDEARVQNAIAQARERFLSVAQERMEVLERAGVGWLENRLRPDVRGAAEREVHRLAGLLATIGFGAGSRFAGEMEELLREGGAEGSGAIRYSELLVALRLELESASRESAAASPPADSKNAIKLMIVDQDRDLAARLEMEALALGISVRVAPGFADAARLIETGAPDVALFDLLLSGREDDGLSFLEMLGNHPAPVPAIVLTSTDTFTNRLEVARRGGHGFISRSAEPARILESVSVLVERLRSGETRIMAVDDDPVILNLLNSLLSTPKTLLKTFRDPLRFWDEFEAFAPHLLVLDLEMPHLNGIELCRVVRNDPRRGDLPIIFLTGHKDPATVQKIFAAGADDFVAKPVVGPELITRINNRIERIRARRSLRETDLKTGLFNRAKSVQMIDGFLKLSSKHDQPFTLALIELANLDLINRELGTGAGDLSIEDIGRTLRDEFRSEDVMGRWDGATFVAGMYGLTRSDGIERIIEFMEHIRKKVLRSAAGIEVNMALSAGVAQYPEDAATIDELCRAAAAALDRAKASGGGRALPAASPNGPRSGEESADVVLAMRDEAQASLLRRSLELRGYRVGWCPDGKMVERTLAGPQPRARAKVLVVDIDLPGRDGIALLRRLASDGVLQTTRVIILTDPSTASAAQSAFELGAFDQMARPFNPPVVVQHIRRALDAV